MTERGDGARWPPSGPALVGVSTLGVVLLLVIAPLFGSMATPVRPGLGDLGGIPSSPIVPVIGDNLAQTAGPNAELAVTPNPAHPGETVTLDASESSSGAGDIACDFDYEGDGSYEVFGDADCLVTESYAAVGTYQPTVRVRDVNQETDTTSTSLTIVENQPPDAAFEWSPSEPTVGESTTFDASASSDPDGEIVAYRWDFDGDGSIDAISSEPVVTHAYDEPGSYVVTLVVEDDDGATDSATFQGLTVTANDPPDAAFTYTPSEPVVDESTAFDASASSDPDGEIVAYRWDFDNDGVFEVETASATTDHVFETTGTYAVTLQVEDDDGATDLAQEQLTVAAAGTPSGGPHATCSASPRSGAPGDPVTLDASGSTGATSVEFDVNGDGTFDRTGDANFRTTVTYDESRSYNPRVRAVGPNGQTNVADCGTVTVGEPNEPPVARFTHERGDSDAVRVITFDASASFDSDGTIVVYRWDFDGDGRVDATSGAPVITHEYPEVREYTAVLEVEDDDGATDDTSNPVDIQSGGIPWQVLIPGFVGLIGGLLVCRGLGMVLPPGRSIPRIGLPAGAGVTDYAAGTFALPADGDTIEINDVGFEPDLVLLTASNAVVAGDATDQIHGTADGWSYGAARRTSNGGFKQHVVAVADDANRPDVAMAAAFGDRGIHLAAADPNGGVGGIVGRVEQTDAEGFELSIDAPTPRANESSDQGDAPADRPVVLYRAFEVDGPGDIELGNVAIPATPGEQTIELDAPADLVTLVATNGVDAFDEVGVVERSLAVSVGTAVGIEEPRQLVTSGALVPGALGSTVAAASDAAVVDFPSRADGDGPLRTRARASSLDDGALDLEWESVATGATDEVGLVSYVAMHAGVGKRPVMGHFELPGPEAEDDLAVDTGFAPGMVEITVVDLDELGERVVPGSPFAFARSHGVAIRREDGTVGQHRLSGAVDPDRPLGALGVERASDDGIASAMLLADEGAELDREVLISEAAGSGLAVDGAGAAITGRDDVTVSTFRETGFDVRTTDVSTDARKADQDGERLVCYTAWPRLDE